MPDDSSGLETLNTAAQGKLKSLIERIERLEEDRKAVGADLREVYAEAKGEGFDTKILRKVVRLRGLDSGKRAEEEALIDLYIAAIGGL
ncbi:MAG TPA: DUF2312 domain-containing protein [Caulobacteraceae bacterium]|jgi:uncharacterized protein (UPF0335 family)|nr:DUF2312 domain-containing protein [Caulobacteraceae bacterium]